MKKLIFIALLIVGCAHNPPTANFKIGMTKEEFIKKNPDLMKNTLKPLVGNNIAGYMKMVDYDSTINRYELENGNWQRI